MSVSLEGTGPEQDEELLCRWQHMRPDGFLTILARYAAVDATSVGARKGL